MKVDEVRCYFRHSNTSVSSKCEAIIKHFFQVRIHYEKELQLSEMNLQREQSQVSELKRQRDLLTNESKKLNSIIRDQEEQYQRKKVRARRSRSSSKKNA